MTTETGTGLVLRLVLALPILLAAWLALVLRFGAPAPTVFVPFPPEQLDTAAQHSFGR